MTNIPTVSRELTVNCKLSIVWSLLTAACCPLCSEAGAGVGTLRGEREPSQPSQPLSASHGLTADQPNSC